MFGKRWWSSPSCKYGPPPCPSPVYARSCEASWRLTPSGTAGASAGGVACPARCRRAGVPPKERRAFRHSARRGSPGTARRAAPQAFARPPEREGQPSRVSSLIPTSDLTIPPLTEPRLDRTAGRPRLRVSGKLPGGYGRQCGLPFRPFAWVLSSAARVSLKQNRRIMKGDLCGVASACARALCAVRLRESSPEPSGTGWRRPLPSSAEIGVAG